MHKTLSANKIQIRLSPLMIPEADYRGVVRELLDALQGTPYECEIRNWRGQNRVTLSYTLYPPRILLPSGYEAQVFPSKSPRLYLEEVEPHHFGDFKPEIDPEKLPLGEISLNKMTQQLRFRVFREMGNTLHENGFGYHICGPEVSEGHAELKVEVPFSLGTDLRGEVFVNKAEIKGTKPSTKGRGTEISIDYDGRFGIVGPPGYLHVYFETSNPDAQDLLTLERVCATLKT